MPVFTYDGLDKQGKRVKGSIESAGRNAALAKLSADGILVAQLSQASDKRKRDRYSFSFKKKALPDVFFQLSILISSGIPLTRALKVTADTVKDTKMKRSLLDMEEKVSSGKRFSDAMKPYEKIYTELYIHLIRTSEKVGRLSSVLLDISRFEEERRKTGEKITSAMMYPSVVMMLGLGVVGFMLTFVVPKLESIFKSAGADIPSSTKILLGTSRFLQDYGMYVFLLLLLLIIGLRKLYTAKGKFRAKVDQKLYKIAFVRHVTVSHLAHVLSFQIREGLPLVEALSNTASGLKNVYVKDALEGVSESVKGGRKFSESVMETQLFDELFVAAVATGEKSGTLPDLLDRVNTYYSRKTEQFTSRFVSIIEPVFIMFIGLVVGFIVISIMDPLFSINTLVK
ncbi:type II secretion system F family protein [Deferribacteres bacterium DY0037]